MSQISELRHRKLTPNLSLAIHSLKGLFLWLLGVSSFTYAQGASITSSGLNTQINDPVTIEGKTQIDITGGTRAGTNLFQSFGEFNVPSNNIANFLNDSGLETSNILGRVNGGNPSNIFGTIQTTGFGNANLFLMNPAGIVFGPNASLNVGGSVSFTTADHLRFTDNGRFNAVPNAATDTLLSTVPVAAYGFLGSNAGAITVQGSQLTVPEGHGISLVGGNITIQSIVLENGASQPAHLYTPGGHVNLASVTSPGEILAGTLDYAPNIHGQSFGSLGTIEILEQSLIDASGNGGGTVFIRGGQFILDNSKISANITGPGPVVNGVESIGKGIDIAVHQNATIQNGAILESNVSGNTIHNVQYGGVHLNGDTVEILGSQDLENGSFTGIRSNVVSKDTGGNSGAIKLEANSIFIKHNSTLETKTFGTGNAGNIVLNAQETILTTTSSIESLSDSGSGHAGNITLIAKGDISMDAPFIRANSSFGTGNAGNILLASTQGNISMTNSPFITSQTEESNGSAGNIAISAPRGNVLLDGGQFGFGSLFTAIRPPIGMVPRTEGSGRIQITANNFKVLNSSISGDNISSLPPGNIDVILTGTLSIGGAVDFGGVVFASKLMTTSRGPARSADLNIRSHNIQVTDRGTISTEAFQSGDAGTLNVITQNLQLTNGSQIRSGSTSVSLGPGEPPSSPRGAGGAVIIRGQAGPADSVLIAGTDSGIFSNTEGTGAGGTIDLSARTFTIQNGGAISASTTGTDTGATGGSIIVESTDQVTMTNGASITASSTGPADAGRILINAGQRFDMQDSSVTTEAKLASGGNIDIKAVDLIRVANGSISSSVQGGPSTAGGNITIDPKTVVLQDAQILASAQQGNGGNITITTPLFLADSRSVVDASSQFGLNGSVTIQSPTSNLSETVGQLASKTSPPQVLLQNRCVALAGGEQSTFILTGRDALPSQPGGWLSSPVAMEHWTGDNIEEHASGLMVRRVEPRVSSPEMSQVQGTEVLSLRRLTPSGFLVRSFADRALTGCRS